MQGQQLSRPQYLTVLPDPSLIWFRACRRDDSGNPPTTNGYLFLFWYIDAVLICRYLPRDGDCWSGWSHSPYLWLVTGPMLAAYLVGQPVSVKCYLILSLVL
jgi:hypothetical protein